MGHTFKLTVYGPVVLPFLAVYIVLMMECIGDVTATSDVSRLPVSGEMYESRIQGGVLGDWYLWYSFNINDHDSNVSFCSK